MSDYDLTERPMYGTDGDYGDLCVASTHMTRLRNPNGTPGCPFGVRVFRTRGGYNNHPEIEPAVYDPFYKVVITELMYMVGYDGPSVNSSFYYVAKQVREDLKLPDIQVKWLYVSVPFNLAHYFEFEKEPISYGMSADDPAKTIYTHDGGPRMADWSIPQALGINYMEWLDIIAPPDGVKDMTYQACDSCGQGMYIGGPGTGWMQLQCAVCHHSVPRFSGVQSL